MQCYSRSLQFKAPNLSNNFFNRRSIRIKSSRLPSDFFGQHNSRRYEISSFSVKKNEDLIDNRKIRTPLCEFTNPENVLNTDLQNQIKRTAINRSWEQNRFKSKNRKRVLQESKEMNKDLRIQTPNFENAYFIEICQKEWRLPKLLNRRLKNRR